MFSHFSISTIIANRLSFNLKLISMGFEVSYLSNVASFCLKIKLQVLDASLKMKWAFKATKPIILITNSPNLILLECCYHLEVTQAVS